MVYVVKCMLELLVHVQYDAKMQSQQKRRVYIRDEIRSKL